MKTPEMELAELKEKLKRIEEMEEDITRIMLESRELDQRIEKLEGGGK